MDGVPVSVVIPSAAGSNPYRFFFVVWIQCQVKIDFKENYIIM